MLLGEYFLPVLADHQDPIGLEDGLALAVDERGAGEVVDVVDGPDDDRPAPAVSRTRQAARAEMQSWVCRMGYSAARRPRALASASTLAKTRSSSVGRLGGASMMVNGTCTGRKKPAAGSPSAITRTGYPAACSASASASVWTTPPRGLTE